MASELMGVGGGGLGMAPLLESQLDSLNSMLAAAEVRESQVEEAERLQHQRHVKALHHLVAQVEAALEKVRDGSYGRCDACGSEIGPEDLKSHPATTLCRKCRGLGD